MELAFSQACENNKHAILSVLQQAFAQTTQVLEIGSGTGQHAIHFAQHLPHVNWQASDLVINHEGINKRVDTKPLKNLLRPISIDLNSLWQIPEFSSQNREQFDGIFTANTMHIVSWELVKKFFINAAQHLANKGTLCVYGPFNYQGNFTSASNANFDLWLKERDRDSGIRDFEAIEQLASEVGLKLVADNTMPANNRLLVFTKE